MHYYLPFLSPLWGTKIGTDLSVTEFLETPAKGAKVWEREVGVHSDSSLQCREIMRWIKGIQKEES